MRRIILLLSLLCMVGGSLAQRAMTPPTVMVVPDLVYCKSHGYTVQFNNDGVTETRPDYERAMSEDPTLHAVLTQIAQLITDRNSDIIIVDLQEAINNANADRQMAKANGGDESEAIDEAIIRNSMADILVKVQFDVVKNGPQYQVQYVLRGTDAYTNRLFAPVEGMGAPSTSASPVVLLREAVYSNMDAFLAKMLSYYSTMLTKGRMVAFDIKVTSTSSVNMDSKVGQYTLKEVIDDFLYDNSVEGGGLEKVKGGKTFLQYDGVYVPVVATVRGRQRRQGARDVAQKLVDYLGQNGVTADFTMRGLGKVNIYIR